MSSASVAFVSFALPSRCCCRRVRLALRAHVGATHSPFPLLDPPGRVVVVVAAAAATVVVLLLLLLLLCRYGTVRSFNLEHHTILFPQTPAASVWSFTAAALEGALTGALHAFRVLLVGPAGTETHLERAALQLDDVRLRPAVVHNFLLLLPRALCPWVLQDHDRQQPCQTWSDLGRAQRGLSLLFLLFLLQGLITKQITQPRRQPLKLTS